MPRQRSRRISASPKASPPASPSHGLPATPKPGRRGTGAGPCGLPGAPSGKCPPAVTANAGQARCFATCSTNEASGRMISGMSIRQDALEQVCPVDQDQPACHPVGPRWLAEDVLEAGRRVSAVGVGDRERGVVPGRVVPQIVRLPAGHVEPRRIRPVTADTEGGGAVMMGTEAVAPARLRAAAARVGCDVTRTRVTDSRRSRARS
jgi:hypothetical protein